MFENFQIGILIFASCSTDLNLYFEKSLFVKFTFFTTKFGHCICLFELISTFFFVLFCFIKIFRIIDS